MVFKSTIGAVLCPTPGHSLFLQKNRPSNHLLEMPSSLKTWCEGLQTKQICFHTMIDHLHQFKKLSIFFRRRGGQREGHKKIVGGPLVDTSVRGPCTPPTLFNMGGPMGGPPLKMTRFGPTWGGRPPQAPPLTETLADAVVLSLALS